MTSKLYCAVLLTLSFALAGCADTSNVAGGISVKSTTSAAFNSSGAPTIEFSLPDMMCEDGCAATVKDILSRQPGAKDVVVDFAAKTATVAIDERAFAADQAIADLVDKGFDHSALAGDATTSEPPATEAPVVQ